MDDLSIEDVDDAWFWQLYDRKLRGCLQCDRFG